MKLVMAIFAVLLAATFAEAGEQAPGKEGEEYVRVEVKGRLATGVVAIGGETTGTTITAGTITWDLDFGDKKDLAAQAEKLDGQRVVVTGLARQVPGVTRGPRIIIRVETLKPAGK